jgi:hypothetical protein
MPAAKGPIQWEVPPIRRLAFDLVLLVAGASLLVTAMGMFRLGGYVLAASLLLSALLRGVLPARYCLGMLIRSRRIDVVTMLVLAVAVGGLARSVPGGVGGS